MSTASFAVPLKNRGKGDDLCINEHSLWGWVSRLHTYAKDALIPAFLSTSKASSACVSALKLIAPYE